MAAGRARYGRRLELDEYERRLVALYAAAPAKPSKEHRRHRARTELDLRVDYLLGTEFPVLRRDALWRAHERIRRNWGELFAHYLVNAIRARLNVGRPTQAGFIPRELARVLDDEDVAAFLDDARRYGPGRDQARPRPGRAE